VFDVNVYGPYRVTQAFAPLIINSKGRIVNISSITGIAPGSMGGQYGMSKHAVEAFTDSLASEMERFGVKVSAIEPGSYASNASETAAKRLESGTNWRENSAYKTELEFMKSAMVRKSAGKDPEDVAKAVMHALSSEAPKRRYLVVGDAYTASMTIGNAMLQMLQLNQGQAYTMNREQLIKMLDEQLKKLD
jgi:NAD(P)-dependent dehydrogenase (short-subunit alcohol dehydrogenase family)